MWKTQIVFESNAVLTAMFLIWVHCGGDDGTMKNDDDDDRLTMMMMKVIGLML